MNGIRRENENLFYSCASRQNRSESTENFFGMDDGIKIVHVKDFLSREWLWNYKIEWFVFEIIILVL